VVLPLLQASPKLITAPQQWYAAFCVIHSTAPDMQILCLPYSFLLSTFEVLVTIENRPELSDPEGATILRDLVLKGTDRKVTDIRTAKMLRLTLEADDADDARNAVGEICDGLRLYNPVVSRARIDVVVADNI